MMDWVLFAVFLAIAVISFHLGFLWSAHVMARGLLDGNQRLVDAVRRCIERGNIERLKAKALEEFHQGRK